MNYPAATAEPNWGTQTATDYPVQQEAVTLNIHGLAKEIEGTQREINSQIGRLAQFLGVPLDAFDEYEPDNFNQHMQKSLEESRRALSAILQINVFVGA